MKKKVSLKAFEKIMGKGGNPDTKFVTREQFSINPLPHNPDF